MSSNPIVVLGARVIDGEPSPMLESRLARALDLYLANPRPIAVSGKEEAEIMGLWLAQRGVAPEHLVIEPEATSTNENLENSWALLPHSKALDVVTSYFHVARTRVWAWHLHIPAVVFGAALPPGNAKTRVKAYVRELIALPHSAARVVWRRIRARRG